MGCHIEIPQDGPLKGSTVFICGKDIRPKPCKFCDEDGLYLCDWKEVERLENIHWHDVRVGDLWVYIPGQPAARVVDIQTEEKGLFFCLDIGKGRIVRPFRFFNSTLTCPILRRGVCDQPMCEAHAREVAEDVHYCMDCWQRQTQLIGASR